MKKLLLLLCLAVLAAGSLLGFTTGKSILFSDSFMLRAQGCEAIYWNPALINPDYSDILLPGINTSFYVANNSLDLDTYNYVMSHDFLDQEDKDNLLAKIRDGHLSVDSEANTSIFGLTIGNVGLASSLHFYGRGSLSKDYLELLLNGNVDSLYVFTKKDNDLSSLTFGDITFGMGDITLPLGDRIPKIKVGFSTSLLVGIYDTKISKFDGFLSSGFDGMTLSQDIIVDTGIVGGGFKGMLGAVSEPMKDLSVGLTLDNLFGFINWGLNTEAIHFNVTADSLYAANIEEDFYTETHEWVDIDNYTTKLPPELRLAGLYRLKPVSVSADWVYPFDSSVIAPQKGRLSLGAEVNLLKYFPIHMGMTFGNQELPAKFSLGMGIKTSYGDIGLGYQSFGSIIPGYTSKGISLGTYFNFRM